MSPQGLTQQEASRRLATGEPNELPAAGRRSAFSIVLEILREPMFGLLVGAGAIYLVLGDVLGGLVLLVFANLSVAISVVQEIRSERVLDALRAMTSPRALVIRDGQRRRIAGREVVPGDVIVIGEGDRVPADAIALSARELVVDESLLTGESVPVAKRARLSDEEKPGDHRVVTIFLQFFQARSSSEVLVSLKSMRQGLTPRSAESARRSRPSIPPFPGWHPRRDGWSGSLPLLDWPQACLPRSCTA